MILRLIFLGMSKNQNAPRTISRLINYFKYGRSTNLKRSPISKTMDEENAKKETKKDGGNLQRSPVRRQPATMEENNGQNTKQPANNRYNTKQRMKKKRGGRKRTCYTRLKNEDY